MYSDQDQVKRAVQEIEDSSDLAAGFQLIMKDRQPSLITVTDFANANQGICNSDTH